MKTTKLFAGTLLGPEEIPPRIQTFCTRKGEVEWVSIVSTGNPTSSW